MKNRRMKSNFSIRGLRITEVTPSSMHCGIGSCPAIFKTDHDTFIIIGSRLNPRQTKQLFPGKLGSGEVAIEVPKELLTV